MVALVYVSSATHLFQPAALQELLAQSRETNARLGVTGALLYHDGNFIQALEGKDAVVFALYAKIANDPRHHRVTTVVEIAPESRLFADWTMAFRDLRDPALRVIPGYRALTQLTWDSSTAIEDPPFVVRLLGSFVERSR